MTLRISCRKTVGSNNCLRNNRLMKIKSRRSLIKREINIRT
jgi:hypothetical protein